MKDCQLSIDCARAQHCAFILSSLRGSNVLDVFDMLGGMYIALGENLSQYWESKNGFRELIEREKSLAKAIEQVRIEGIETLSALGLPFSGASMKALSPAMMHTFRKAHESAISRESTGKPVVKPEDFLLALATEPSTELGPKMLESGVDLVRLGQAVK